MHGRAVSPSRPLPTRRRWARGAPTTSSIIILSCGPTPSTPLENWSFTIRGLVDEPVSWTWEELRSLPSETVTRDIHCVTKWSKLGTTWTGVAIDTLLDGVETSADYVVAFDGDPVSKGRQGRQLPELVEIETTGQPRAVIYRAR